MQMKTVLDGPMRRVTQRLIKKFGTAITLRSVTKGGYSVATGMTVDTYKDFPTHAIVEPFERGTDASVQFGDVSVMIAAKALENLRDPDNPTQRIRKVEPKTDDLIRIDGDNYRVIDMNKTYSGRLVNSYEMQARR